MMLELKSVRLNKAVVIMYLSVCSYLTPGIIGMSKGKRLLSGKKTLGKKNALRKKASFFDTYFSYKLLTC